MENIFVVVFFSIGLAIGILATSFANRRAGNNSQRAEFDAIKAEFMVYRSTAQDALSNAQEDLDELCTRYTQLQTKLGEFKTKLSETPTSFSSDEDTERRRLPLLSKATDCEVRNSNETATIHPVNQAADYVR